MAIQNKAPSLSWPLMENNITRDDIQVWLDDKQIIDQSIVGKTISLRAEVEPSKPLGIASFQTTAAIGAIRYRLLRRG